MKKIFGVLLLTLLILVLLGSLYFAYSFIMSQKNISPEDVTALTKIFAYKEKSNSKDDILEVFLYDYEGPKQAMRCELGWDHIYNVSYFWATHSPLASFFYDKDGKLLADCTYNKNPSCRVYSFYVCSQDLVPSFIEAARLGYDDRHFPAISHSSTIIVPGNNRRILAFDSSNLKLLWQQEITKDITAPLKIIGDYSLLVPGFGILRLSDGKILAENYKEQDRIDPETPFLDSLTEFNPQTGRVQWKLTTNYANRKLYLPVGQNQKYYFVREYDTKKDQGSLLTIERSSGKEIQRFPLEYYVSSDENILVARTGSLKEKTPIILTTRNIANDKALASWRISDDSITDDIYYNNNMIIVPSMLRKLTKYDATNGQILWESVLGNSPLVPASSPNPNYYEPLTGFTDFFIQDGLFFVTNGNNKGAHTAYQIDPNNGKVLWHMGLYHTWTGLAKHFGDKMFFESYNDFTSLDHNDPYREHTLTAIQLFSDRPGQVAYHTKLKLLAGPFAPSWNPYGPTKDGQRFFADQQNLFSFGVTEKNKITITSYNPDTGQPIWNFSTPGVDVIGQPMLIDKKIFITTAKSDYSAELHMIDTSSGKEIAKQQVHWPVLMLPEIEYY